MQNHHLITLAGPAVGGLNGQMMTAAIVAAWPSFWLRPDFNTLMTLYPFDF